MERFERNKSPAPREQGGARPDSAAYEREREILNSLMTAAAEYYRSLGIKLFQDGRINPSAFTQCRDVNEFNEHTLFVKKQEEKWKKWEREERELGKQVQKEWGVIMRATDKDPWQRIDSEFFEQLVPLLFTKVMPEKFIAVRSAKYDDYTNGVDTIIIDRDTGEILCSVDEFTSDKEMVTGHKVKKVMQVNSNGTVLSYGYKRESNDSFVPVKACGNFPVCVLSIPRSKVHEIIGILGEGLDNVSDLEKKAFKELIDGLHDSLNAILEGIRERERERKSDDPYERMAMRVEEDLKKRVNRARKLFSDISATVL